MTSRSLQRAEEGSWGGITVATFIWKGRVAHWKKQRPVLLLQKRGRIGSLLVNKDARVFIHLQIISVVFSRYKNINVLVGF